MNVDGNGSSVIEQNACNATAFSVWYAFVIGLLVSVVSAAAEPAPFRRGGERHFARSSPPGATSKDFCAARGTLPRRLPLPPMRVMVHCGAWKPPPAASHIPAASHQWNRAPANARQNATGRAQPGIEAALFFFGATPHTAAMGSGPTRVSGSDRSRGYRSCSPTYRLR